MRARFATTVHLLLIRNEKICLLRRMNTGYRDGELTVPAGHLDGGETVIDAAAREALEEVGLMLDSQDIEFSSVMHRNEDEERVDFFLKVRRWDGEPFNAEPDKCSEVLWADLKHLPADTIPYVVQGIANHLNGTRFHEFGWDSNG